MPSEKLLTIYATLRRAIQRHGVAGVLGKAFHSAAEWRHERRSASEPDAFDAHYGTNTGGIVPLWKLHVEGPHREHGVRYQAADPVQVRRCIESLPIDPSQFTFVDLGSGKGRCLIIASEFPFERVIGVEFAPDLHAIAEENLRRWKGPQRRCALAESRCGDAAAFDFPSSNLVLFLYNPFGASVLRRVVERLEQSILACDRTVYVLYRNPSAREVFDASSYFEPLDPIADTARFVHSPK